MTIDQRRARYIEQRKEQQREEQTAKRARITQKSAAKLEGQRYGRAYGKARYGGGVGYLLPDRDEAIQLALNHVGISPRSHAAWEFRQGFAMEFEHIMNRAHIR